MVVKITVLLADDHVVLREATAELINHQPDMVVTGQAGTGEETILLAREKNPNVIVMDVAMPRLDGLEATKRILAKCPQTRILVLSAHQDAEYVIPLLEAGATSYLPKTISLTELLDAIRATNRGEAILPPSIASVVVNRLSSGLEKKETKRLTEREMEVLMLVAQGNTNDQIAHQLHLSTRTVEAHLTHIYNKLNANSRTEAAIIAMRKGWINDD